MLYMVMMCRMYGVYVCVRLGMVSLKSTTTDDGTSIWSDASLRLYCLNVVCMYLCWIVCMLLMIFCMFVLVIKLVMCVLVFVCFFVSYVSAEYSTKKLLSASWSSGVKSLEDIFCNLLRVLLYCLFFGLFLIVIGKVVEVFVVVWCELSALVTWLSVVAFGWIIGFMIDLVKFDKLRLCREEIVLFVDVDVLFFVCFDLSFFRWDCVS